MSDAARFRIVALTNVSVVIRVCSVKHEQLIRHTSIIGGGGLRRTLTRAGEMLTNNSSVLRKYGVLTIVPLLLNIWFISKYSCLPVKAFSRLLPCRLEQCIRARWSSVRMRQQHNTRISKLMTQCPHRFESAPQSLFHDLHLKIRTKERSKQTRTLRCLK